MVQAINLKKGMIFSQDGKLIKVLKANHHKPGKGNTVMQMDLRDVKNKIKDNDKLQDLKKKYDNGTEIVKNQLASFPKNVEDDSELKDFDDIVIFI